MAYADSRWRKPAFEVAFVAGISIGCFCFCFLLLVYSRLFSFIQ
jgi:hypothetical protein